jgi:hypothetical protein
VCGFQQQPAVGTWHFADKKVKVAKGLVNTGGGR